MPFIAEHMQKGNGCNMEKKSAMCRYRVVAEALHNQLFGSIAVILTETQSLIYNWIPPHSWWPLMYYQLVQFLLCVLGSDRTYVMPPSYAHVDALLLTHRQLEPDTSAADQCLLYIVAFTSRTGAQNLLALRVDCILSWSPNISHTLCTFFLYFLIW